MSGLFISERGVTSVKLLACSEFLAPGWFGTFEPCERNETSGSFSSPAWLRNESNLHSDSCRSTASTKLKRFPFAFGTAPFRRKVISPTAEPGKVLLRIIVGIIHVHTQRVTRKAKITAKASGLAKPGPKRPSGIRLDDLMPKKRVTGGRGLLFGASDNSQPQTNQPTEET